MDAYAGFPIEDVEGWSAFGHFTADTNAWNRRFIAHVGREKTARRRFKVLTGTVCTQGNNIRPTRLNHITQPREKHKKRDVRLNVVYLRSHVKLPWIDVVSASSVERNDVGGRHPCLTHWALRLVRI